MSAAHATEPACTTANCPPTAHTCDAHKGTEHKADAAACAHCDDAKATAHGKTAGETIKGAAVQTGKAIEHGATVAKDDVVWAATATGSAVKTGAVAAKDDVVYAAEAAGGAIKSGFTHAKELFTGKPHDKDAKPVAAAPAAAPAAHAK